MILSLAVLIQYRSVTDTHTHTDRQTRHMTMAYTALSIVSRDKNNCWQLYLRPAYKATIPKLCASLHYHVVHHPALRQLPLFPAVVTDQLVAVTHHCLPDLYTVSELSHILNTYDFCFWCIVYKYSYVLTYICNHIICIKNWLVKRLRKATAACFILS